MAIRYQGEIRTAKQAAQELIADKIFIALEYWFEDDSINTENQWNQEKIMTKKEYEEVRRQIRIIAGRALKPCDYKLKE